MLIVDVCVAGQHIVRRFRDAWSETDHPRKGGKFVKKGEGVGAANELSEKHGVTGDHTIHDLDGKLKSGSHGKTVREFVKQHGPKAANELLEHANAGSIKFKHPVEDGEQHYTVHNPRTKEIVASGSLKDIKKKGIYVYSKHAVAADILGSARLGGGTANNKGEHKGKTYVLRAKGSTPSATAEDPLMAKIAAATAMEPVGGNTAAAPATTALTAPAPLAASAAGPVDTSAWKQVGPQLGSNPGGTYEDESGTKHYVKQLKSKAHVESERLANALYEKLGVKTLQPQHVMVNGKDGIASKFQDVTKFSADKLFDKSRAQDHFVAHAFLANHDATGQSQDNHGFVGGKYATLDAGGSLKYRAQGALKNKFDGNVDELNTLRDGTNAASAAVFGSMDHKDIAASAKAVTALSDADIHDIVHQHVSDKIEAAHLTSVLKQRRDNIKTRVATMTAVAQLKEMQAKPVEQSSVTPPKANSKTSTLLKTPRTAPAEPQFHVKTPLTGKLVAQGTIPELNAKGISTSEKQVKGATENGQHHLNSAFHMGEHKGQKYVLHKGDPLAATTVVEKAKFPWESDKSKATHEPTPGFNGFAGSDDFKRPDVGTIEQADYLAHSKKQHQEVFGGSASHTKEVSALHTYTGSAHHSINAKLRAGQDVGAYAETVQHLDTLTKRSKLVDDHVLWRGVSSAGMHHVTSLEPGGHYHDPGFTSTSHNQNTARSFAGFGGVLMAIRAKKGSSGVHAGDLGMHTAEHEVILPKGSKLRYAGRSSEGHYVFDHVD